MLVSAWSRNERLGQIATLLGAAEVAGVDMDPPSCQWADDIATIDAAQARAIRRDRKRAKRKAEDDEWRNKRYEDTV